MELGLYDSLIARAVDCTGTGVKHGLCPARPIDVIRAGIIVTVASTANAVFALKKRPTPGSATGESVLATITMATASRAIGSVLFADCVLTRISPGQEVIVECTTLGTLLFASIFIDYQNRGLHKRDVSSAYYAKLFDSAPTVG